jgi:hypothetical protein
VNKLQRHKTLVLRGEINLFQNFQQSSCGVALALLKNLNTGPTECFGPVGLTVYLHRQQQTSRRTWQNIN